MQYTDIAVIGAGLAGVSCARHRVRPHIFHAVVDADDAVGLQFYRV